MFQKVSVHLSLIAFLFSLNNCATMSAREDGLQVIFVKAPADSHIYLDGEKIGETFGASLIDSPKKDPNKQYKLRIEKDGFEPKEIEVTKEIHMLFGWNLIFLVGAPIGFAVDYFSGSYLHYNRWVEVNLDQKSNFKVNLNSESNRNYVQKRDADQNLPVTVKFNKVESVSYEKTDANGNPIQNTSSGQQWPGGEYGDEAKLSQGYYKISGYYRSKDYNTSRTASVTRVAKLPGTKVLAIPGGGVGAICGAMDEKTNRTTFYWIHLPDFISKKLGESIYMQSYYIAKHCEQVFDLKQYLSQS
ncbi:hypothetical protein EHQ59_10610 [Leptospira kemamanensis]|uniref:PEGA domain-containing protein n=1 Tax=Leptospira kemamanensis TaxID=2484942 RepID=A0A4R9JQ27_9LEPT|nr:hypothetical protein [Leptospira kemamanensis]TGL51349.1 hypothetical protein EHQ59_10610 [Leptospira kemamanensis]